MISQPMFSSFFPVLHCPLGLGELQVCPFPNVVFPPFPLSGAIFFCRSRNRSIVPPPRSRFALYRYTPLIVLCRVSSPPLPPPPHDVDTHPYLCIVIHIHVIHNYLHTIMFIHVHYHHHLFLNCEARWGATDDFTTSFLHSSMFSTAPWDLANSRSVQSLMLSSHLFLGLPCLHPFTLPCKMVLARPDEREICPYHCSLRLFTMVRRSSCGPITCWILARTWSFYEMRSILR